MVKKDAVSEDFRKQVLGYGLTTAEIVYRRPDRHGLLQTSSRSGKNRSRVRCSQSPSRIARAAAA